MAEMNTLSQSAQAFILHFGEMGSRWGINRTVGQIYALLYISSDPLNAETIADTLGVSRSNVSMGMKELQSWRLVNVKHQVGDRRDYFETPGDVLDIAMILLEERRKRELDPTLTLLRQTLMEAPASDDDKYAHERMQEMHDLMEQVSRWSTELLKLDAKDLSLMITLGSAVPKLLEFKGKLKLVDKTVKKKGG